MPVSAALTGWFDGLPTVESPSESITAIFARPAGAVAVLVGIWGDEGLARARRAQDERRRLVRQRPDRAGDAAREADQADARHRARAHCRGVQLLRRGELAVQH